MGFPRLTPLSGRRQEEQSWGACGAARFQRGNVFRPAFVTPAALGPGTGFSRRAGCGGGGPPVSPALCGMREPSLGFCSSVCPGRDGSAGFWGPCSFESGIFFFFLSNY